MHDESLSNTAAVRCAKGRTEDGPPEVARRLPDRAMLYLLCLNNLVLEERTHH